MEVGEMAEGASEGEAVSGGEVDAAARGREGEGCEGRRGKGQSKVENQVSKAIHR